MTSKPSTSSPSDAHRRLTIPFALSLAIHAVLLVALVWWGLSKFDGPTDADKQAGASSAATLTPKQEAEAFTDDLAARLDAGLDQAAGESDAQKVATAESGGQWLEANSSEQAVGEIAGRVREAYDTPDRAYAPVVPPPPGRFDMRSMLPYAGVTQVDPDGVERTHQTWVDAEGRTMVQTRRRITDEDGKTWVMVGVFEADGELFETKMPDDGDDAVSTALDTVAKSPLLRKLFSEAVLPMLEAKRLQQEGEATPRPAPNEPRP